MQDFEAARDRVLMGQRRESLVLSDDEKERVAFHEGGHAVLAYVLRARRSRAQGDHPAHRHGPGRDPAAADRGAPHLPASYIEDSLAVRMGGRAAELLVYGDLSTGASNDLVGNTELARKMVREWGMSDEHRSHGVGLAGQVFLGEDLMHTRDYSEDTARVVDAEVARILPAPRRAGHRVAQPPPGRSRRRGPRPARRGDPRRRRPWGSWSTRRMASRSMSTG